MTPEILEQEPACAGPSPRRRVQVERLHYDDAAGGAVVEDPASAFLSRCQGTRPSTSRLSARLRKVRIRTLLPRMPTL
jgi:hypothetical protein